MRVLPLFSRKTQQTLLFATLPEFSSGHALDFAQIFHNQSLRASGTTTEYPYISLKYNKIKMLCGISNTRSWRRNCMKYHSVYLTNSARLPQRCNVQVVPVNAHDFCGSLALRAQLIAGRRGHRKGATPPRGCRWGGLRRGYRAGLGGRRGSRL